MTQRPSGPVCDCCGLLITPGAGEICPRCHYPISLLKEEQFLQSSVRDLLRVASYGGANITVSNLIRRYQARLAYLHYLQTGGQPQGAISSQPILPLEAQGTKPPVKTSALPPQEVVAATSIFAPWKDVPQAAPAGAALEAPPVPGPGVMLPGMAGMIVSTPPQTKPPAIPLVPQQPTSSVKADGVPVRPVPAPVVAPHVREPRRPARRSIRLVWRSFVVDQAITLMGLLGAFLILMGALSSVVTTGNNPLLSFLVVFGVHAFFGIAGVVSFRFANFKLIARIYSGIYVLLVPLVGFTGYNLLVGSQVALSVPTLVMIASLYAAVVYIALAVYQKFAVYGYLGVIALVVADLAIASDLHLNYCWWPSLLMLLALPALASIARSLGTERKRYFTGSLEVLRQPARIVMYVIIWIVALSAVEIASRSFSSDELGLFSQAVVTEIRFSLLSVVVLLSIWIAAWLGLTRRTRYMFWLAFLFLACVLSFCYAFDFSQSGYVLTLAVVALLYHGLNRFLPYLLLPLDNMSQCLEGIALSLVCLLPFIASPLLPQQLYATVYQLPLYGSPNLYISANWAAVAELIAVGIGCLISVSMSLLYANRSNRRSWLLLLSGFLLAWELGVIVLALGLAPIWWFLGLTLAGPGRGLRNLGNRVGSSDSAWLGDRDRDRGCPGWFTHRQDYEMACGADGWSESSRGTAYF